MTLKSIRYTALIEKRQKIKCSESLNASMSFKLELLSAGRSTSRENALILTYKWMLHAELITFVHQLVWAHLIGNCGYVLVDVLIGAQPRFQHSVLFTLRLAPDWLLQTGLSSEQHIRLSLPFLHFLLSLLF